LLDYVSPMFLQHTLRNNGFSPHRLLPLFFSRLAVLFLEMGVALCFLMLSCEWCRLSGPI
jgi:hypothetical protein